MEGVIIRLARQTERGENILKRFSLTNDGDSDDGEDDVCFYCFLCCELFVWFSYLHFFFFRFLVLTILVREYFPQETVQHYIPSNQLMLIASTFSFISNPYLS